MTKLLKIQSADADILATEGISRFFKNKILCRFKDWQRICRFFHDRSADVLVLPLTIVELVYHLLMLG